MTGVKLHQNSQNRTYKLRSILLLHFLVHKRFGLPN